MKPSPDACQKFEALLDDYVDRTLEAATEQRVESHLATCASCAQEVKELRQLLASVTELPRSLELEHNLWPQISAQLEPRSVDVDAQPRGRSQRGWWLQVAAALFFVILGVFLGRLTAATSPGGEESAAGSETRLASWQEGAVSNGFGLAEAEFLRAKETLWLLALRNQDELSPVTRKVVERNLRILDKAIEELRAALENDPGNPELEHLLLNHHRRGVDLLARLARTEA